jgi:hypothetical protein
LCGDLRREITTVQGNHNNCGKSKHDFWCIRLFIIVKTKPLIDDLTGQNKRTAYAELFQLCRWCEFQQITILKKQNSYSLLRSTVQRSRGPFDHFEIRTNSNFEVLTQISKWSNGPYTALHGAMQRWIWIRRSNRG